MKDIERTRQQSPDPEAEAGRKVLLDEIRERLQTDPSVYFAGEQIKADDGSRFDQHIFFVAPTTPHFDPAALTTFAQRALTGFDMTSTRGARIHDTGDMQLPDAFVDQPIGTREIKTIMTTTIELGSFKGRDTKQVEEDIHTEKLIQRTMVKVFTDPHLAQTLFDYSSALARKELDEQQSTNLVAVYTTHVVSAIHLAALQRYYQQNSNTNVPTLPQAQ